MKRLVCIAFAISINFCFAQKLVTVKKGEIKQNNTTIATFDGKGGNAFRFANYTITAVGQTTPFVTIKEDNLSLLNPFFEDGQAFFEIAFSNSQKFYYMTKPEKKKFFGNIIMVYPRLTGNDIIEVLFNDTVPPIIIDSQINYVNVQNFFDKNGYPKDKITNEVKKLEDSIANYTSQKIIRDIKKPIVLKSVYVEGAGLGQWFSVLQDNVELGRVYKLIGNSAIYQVWKKTNGTVELQGKKVDYAPIVMTASLTKGNHIKKLYEYIMVVGKEKVAFSSNDFNNAELDILYALVKAGSL
jgi:hypothetical protein